LPLDVKERIPSPVLTW